MAVTESAAVAEKARHPAPFNRAALRAAEQNLARRFGEYPARVLDPFCGVGRVHELRDRGWLTVGGELEPEWAAASPRTVVADALRFPAPDAAFDAVITSPTWGNRLADHHYARERCSACGGEGTVERLATPEEVDDGHELGIAFDPCPKCEGRGRRDYVRNTYRHALGRALTGGSSGGMQFGASYRRLHRDWLVEVRRLLRPGGLLVVNVGNHIRAGREVDVVGWWLTAVLAEGFLIRSVERIAAAKLRHGANGHLRVDGEINVVAEAPA